MLASLAGAFPSNDKNDPWEAVAASQPQDASADSAIDERLNVILDRIKQVTASPPDESSPPGSHAAVDCRSPCIKKRRSFPGNRNHSRTPD